MNQGPSRLRIICRSVVAHIYGLLVAHLWASSPSVLLIPDIIKIIVTQKKIKLNGIKENNGENNIPLLSVPVDASRRLSAITTARAQLII